MYYSLDFAAKLVSGIQESCMKRGYYIALAGGVINKGWSTNDIDLVAVPMAGESNSEGLISYLTLIMELLREPTKQSRGRCVDIYHFDYKNVKIDLALIGV